MKTTDVRNFLAAPFRIGTYKDVGVLLEQLFAGTFHLSFLISAAGIVAGSMLSIIAAPLGIAALVGTLYLNKKSVNLEFKLLKTRAEDYGIDQEPIGEKGGTGLLESSRNTFFDRNSWSAVLVSLLRFPLGLASFTFLAFYYSLSVSLIAAPLVYKNSYYFQANGTRLVTTLPEAFLTTLAGFAVLIVGANAVQAASYLSLRLMAASNIENELK